MSLTASCTSLLGDFKSNSETDASSNDATTDAPVGVSDDASNDAGNGLGSACTGTGTCATGQTCTDGVCCDKPCDGVCEKCNLPGSMGTCTAVPANTDPDKECVMMPVPDAGTDASSIAVDGSSEAGDAGDAASTDAADGASTNAPDASTAGGADGGDAATSDASASDAEPLATPDGGLMPDNTKCAGSCDGKRECQYPGASTSCGAQFCGSASEQAGLVCDSTGRCNLASTDCANYVCESSSSCGAGCTGKCATTCQSGADCSPSAFCNAQGVCQAKKGTGAECANANECGLGECDNGYCCNTDCSKIPGGRCDLPGSAGQCKCNLDCGDGGACQAYYYDNDGDGHGDPNTVQAFCAGSTNLGRYVASNDDCDDNDKNTFPGQTAWFTTPRANGTFEYNCVSTVVQEYPVYPGAACGYCSTASGSCSNSQTTCSSSGEQAYLSCSSFIVRCLVCKAVIFGGGCEGDTVDVNGTGYAEAFTQPTACGASGPFTYCGTCSAAGDAPYTDSYDTLMPCH